MKRLLLFIAMLVVGVNAYGQRTPKVVDSVGSLASLIPSASQPDVIVSDGTNGFTLYKYSASSTQTTNGVDSLGTQTGVGRWIKINLSDSFIQVPDFAPQVNTVDEPEPNQLFQRSGLTGDIYISGTVSGPTGTAVEARFNGGSWQTVDTSNVYGEYSGTITGSLVRGSVEVRAVGTSTTITVTNVGVGDIFHIWGQSNGSGRLVADQSYTNATPEATILGNDYVWKVMADKTDSNVGQIDTVSSDSDSEMGSIWPFVADGWETLTGIPVAFVQSTKGATGFSGSPSWVPGSDLYDRTTLFGSAMNRIRTTRGARAILWWQGEGGFDDTTGASYITPFTNMVAAVQREYPGLKLVPCKLQECVGITSPRLTNGWYAIGRLWSEHTNVVLTGPTLADAPVGAASNILTENEGSGLPYYHVKTPTNGMAAAYRWVTNLEANFKSTNNIPTFLQ